MKVRNINWTCVSHVVTGVAEYIEQMLSVVRRAAGGL